jgi:hypothetical protein
MAMAEAMKQDEIVSLEEVVVSNVYTQEALINVLVKKGLISKEEIIDEIKRLKAEGPQ